MDRREAKSVAEAELAVLRQESYVSLVERLLDRQETCEVVAPSGKTYQVEVMGFWDSGRKHPGNLRVMVAVDDGGIRAFAPLTVDFIIAADGSFVGEGSGRS